MINAGTGAPASGEENAQGAPVPVVRVPIRGAIHWGLLRRRLGATPAAVISGALLLLIYAACWLIPAFVPQFSAGGTGMVPFLRPSFAHLFGTDDFGRDVLVRTFASGRVDITVGVMAVAFSMVLGSVVGTLAATSNRWVDAVLMRVVDSLIAFPYLIVIMVLVVIVGPGTQIGPTPPGLTAILIALLALDWTFYARIARGQALSIRSRDYVVATTVLGFSRSRVLFKHIIPGLFRVVLAYGVSDCILTMGALASFAFLGVGVQAPTAEWGAMMYEGRAYLQSAWWMTVFPGALLVLTGVALSVLADSLKPRGE